MAPALPRVTLSMRTRAMLVLSGGLLAIGLLYSGIATSGPVVCPFRLVFRLPCPSCGMVRSLAALSHGDLAYAVALNPASLMVTALTGIVFATSLVELFTGRDILVRLWKNSQVRTITAVLVVSVMAGVWVINLSRHFRGAGPLHIPAWHSMHMQAMAQGTERF